MTFDPMSLKLRASLESVFEMASNSLTHRSFRIFSINYWSNGWPGARKYSSKLRINVTW